MLFDPRAGLGLGKSSDCFPGTFVKYGLSESVSAGTAQAAARISVQTLAT